MNWTKMEASEGLVVKTDTPQGRSRQERRRSLRRHQERSSNFTESKLASRKKNSDL